MNKIIYADLELLKNISLKVLEKCKVERTINLVNESKQLRLRVPSGDMKYGAFWVRDAAMMAESGLIEAEEIKDWIYLIAVAGQNGYKAISLDNGLVVPPWAVADHISFDGKATYYPGTMNTGNDQGNGKFGFYPPHDDQYYFIEMAYLYYEKSNDTGFLAGNAQGIQMIDRLEKAFASYNIDEENQLCTSDIPKFTVDWGFCDTIIKSGYLLFPSLLRYRASMRLKVLFEVMKNDSKASMYYSISKTIKENVIKAFYKEGRLLSSTGSCRQNDIWGMAFALWVNILDGKYEQEIANTLLSAFRNGTAVDNGYVRHILTDEDALESSAWEKATSDYNTYQNGGYWATPTGWYAYALSLVDMDAAQDMVHEFVKHILKFESLGAPFEWRSTYDSLYSGLLYGASAALPYVGVLRIISEKNPDGMLYKQKK